MKNSYLGVAVSRAVKVYRLQSKDSTLLAGYKNIDISMMQDQHIIEKVLSHFELYPEEKDTFIECFKVVSIRRIRYLDPKTNELILEASRKFLLILQGKKEEDAILSAYDLYGIFGDCTSLYSLLKSSKEFVPGVINSDEEDYIVAAKVIECWNELESDESRERLTEIFSLMVAEYSHEKPITKDDLWSIQAIRLLRLLMQGVKLNFTTK